MLSYSIMRKQSKTQKYNEIDCNYLKKIDYGEVSLEYYLVAKPKTDL
jgi:hypothetical protein